MIGVVLAAALVVGLCAGAATTKCQYPFYVVNPFQGAPAEARVMCLAEGGCKVRWSPVGCGCDADCVGAEQMLGFGSNVISYDFGNTIDAGIGICSDEQISAHYDDSNAAEWPRASSAGSRFAYVKTRRGDPTICFVGALGKSATVEYEIFGRTSASTQVALNPFSGVQLQGLTMTDSLLAIRSTADIVLACWAGSDGTRKGADYTVVFPVSSGPIYGWQSSWLAVAQVDCDTLVPFTDTKPSCEFSSGAACTFPYTLDATRGLWKGTTGGATLYSGPGMQVKPASGKCISVVTQADSNGSESTHWIPQARFTERMVLPGSIRHVAFLSLQSLNSGSDIVCVIGRGTSEESTFTLQGSGGSSVTNANVQYGGSDTFSAGVPVECTGPVNIVADVFQSEQLLLGLEAAGLWAPFRMDQCPPTNSPTSAPSQAPTTKRPTSAPSRAPTTKRPSSAPSQAPTTKQPTFAPSQAPSTKQPTFAPSQAPTTKQPTSTPSQAPIILDSPSKAPTTKQPTVSPSPLPTESNMNGTKVNTKEKTNEGLSIMTIRIAGGAGAAAFLLALVAATLLLRRRRSNRGSGPTKPSSDNPSGPADTCTDGDDAYNVRKSSFAVTVKDSDVPLQQTKGRNNSSFDPSQYSLYGSASALDQTRSKGNRLGGIKVRGLGKANFFE